MRFAAICIIFGFFGMGMETFFTAFDVAWKRYKRKKPFSSLNGYSSMKYLPLYSSTPLLILLCKSGGLFAQPWAIRGLVYMLIIFFVEYFSMWALEKLPGGSPVEKTYPRSRWHIHGRIKITLAPAWFVVGLTFEYLFLLINP